MKNVTFRKLGFFIIALVITGIGLSGCVTLPPITFTGTAKIVLSGTHYYNIKMDDYTYFYNRQSGTYTVTEITEGYHTFEAIDVDGASFGYASKEVYISAGTTTTVSLNPKETTSYGTAKIILSGSDLYDIKMDGITQWDSVPSGTYTLNKIPAGSHKFEAIDTWGSSFGYDSKTVYISAGMTTTVNLKPSSPSTNIGSLAVTIKNDPGYKYRVYLGTSSSGRYLGVTSGSLSDNYMIAHNIPTGNQNIYLVRTDGVNPTLRTIYINANMTNLLDIWVIHF